MAGYLDKWLEAQLVASLVVLWGYKMVGMRALWMVVMKDVKRVVSWAVLLVELKE